MNILFKIFNNPLSHLLITKFCPRQFFSLFLRKKLFYLETKGPFYILSFDLDYSKDILAIPEVLKTLKKYSILSSFACIGRWIEKYPDIHKQILREGHEIINHTYSHYDNDELGSAKSFNRLSFEQKLKEIEEFHRISKEILNYEPVGFRTPHFGRAHTKDVYDILKDLKYIYSSSTADVGIFSKFGAPYKDKKTGIIEIPVGCSSKFPFYIFDSWSSRTGPRPLFPDDEEFLNEFYKTIDILNKTKSLVVHYFDPFDIVQNDKLDRMCFYLKKQKIQVLTCKKLLEKTNLYFNGRIKN